MCWGPVETLPRSFHCPLAERRQRFDQDDSKGRDNSKKKRMGRRLIVRASPSQRREGWRTLKFIGCVPEKYQERPPRNAHEAAARG